jgi:hypothetical protein
MTDGDSYRMTSLAIVVGGGTMASGSPRASCRLAAKWPASRSTITGRDRTQTTIDGGPVRWAARNAGTERREEARTRLPMHHGGLPDVTPQLVIETVPEVAALKHSVLAEYSARYPGAALTSNTSALLIDELASSVDHRGRFIGIHFSTLVASAALILCSAGPGTLTGRNARSADPRSEISRQKHGLVTLPVTADTHAAAAGALDRSPNNSRYWTDSIG